MEHTPSVFSHRGVSDYCQDEYTTRDIHTCETAIYGNATYRLSQKVVADNEPKALSATMSAIDKRL